MNSILCKKTYVGLVNINGKCGSSNGIISCQKGNCFEYTCKFDPDWKEAQFQFIMVKMTFLSAKADFRLLYSVCTHVKVTTQGEYYKFSNRRSLHMGYGPKRFKGSHIKVTYKHSGWRPL